MSRRPANITQADIARAIRAADHATTNRHVSEVSRLIEMAYCRLSPDLMMESSAPLDKRTGSGIALDIKDAAGMRWRYERSS